MFTFRRPNDDDVRALLARQHSQPWTYPWPEITRGHLADASGFHGSPPILAQEARSVSEEFDPAPRRGWQIDRHRVLLGHGAETFDAACAALRQWQMFPRAMCQVFWPDTPQRPGDVVAVLYRSQVFQLWMLFPARVVYRIDESRRCGFAYGTLPEHPERGEERFLVEWNKADDSVWYELLAVSRPGHWLARLGYPYARYEQAKFRRLSGEAMQAAVERSEVGGQKSEARHK